MSSSIKRPVTLMNQSAAGNGTWYNLDTRYENQSYRPITVSVVSGDSILIEVTAKDIKGGDKSFLNTLLPGEIITLTTITTSGSYEIDGSWAFVRAVKTGTAGTALVEGII